MHTNMGRDSKCKSFSLASMKMYLSGRSHNPIAARCEWKRDEFAPSPAPETKYH
jgi:hypothetical protein